MLTAQCWELSQNSSDCWDVLLFCCKIGAFSSGESRNSPETAGTTSSNWSNIRLYFGPNYGLEILKWSDLRPDQETPEKIFWFVIGSNRQADQQSAEAGNSVRPLETFLECVATLAADFFLSSLWSWCFFLPLYPNFMRSLEQKMGPGTNVSSSKTTERNILIVFYLLLCFWWVEKIVDNEQVRQTQPQLCWKLFNCRPGSQCECWTVGTKMPRY